jgi:Ca2+/Na+ antiporter
MTCPDCAINEPKEGWYPVTFLVSLTWLSVQSWVVTAVVQRWVGMLHSKAAMSFLGYVLVALAAQIPDTANSVTTAKRGYGSMAMSSALGSQTINTSIGLGVPWLITVGLGIEVPVDGAGSGLVHGLYVQLAVCVFLAAILLGDAYIRGQNKAQLTKAKAAVCLVGYVAVIIWQAYRTFQTDGEQSEKPKASDGA